MAASRKSRTVAAIKAVAQTPRWLDARCEIRTPDAAGEIHTVSTSWPVRSIPVVLPTPPAPKASPVRLDRRSRSLGKAVSSSSYQPQWSIDGAKDAPLEAPPKNATGRWRGNTPSQGLKIIATFACLGSTVRIRGGLPPVPEDIQTVSLRRTRESRAKSVT